MLDMDRVDSGVMVDQSGFGNDAEVHGIPNFVENRFGVSCRALEFDGSLFLSIPDAVSINFQREFTVATWVLLPDSQGLQWITLLCKGESKIEGVSSPAYRLQLTSNTVSINTSSTRKIGRINQSFPENIWFHLGVTFHDGDATSNSHLEIFVDGQRISGYTMDIQLRTNRENLNIGRDIPGNTEHFLGALDDLRIYNEALQPAEILAIVNDDEDRFLPSGCITSTVGIDWHRMQRQPAQILEPSVNWKELVDRNEKVRAEEVRAMAQQEAQKLLLENQRLSAALAERQAAEALIGEQERKAAEVRAQRESEEARLLENQRKADEASAAHARADSALVESMRKAAEARAQRESEEALLLDIQRKADEAIAARVKAEAALLEGERKAAEARSRREKEDSLLLEEQRKSIEEIEADDGVVNEHQQKIEAAHVMKEDLTAEEEPELKVHAVADTSGQMSQGLSQEGVDRVGEIVYPSSSASTDGAARNDEIQPLTTPIMSIRDVPIRVAERVSVNPGEVVLSMYDHDEIDNDTVTVYLNKVSVFEHYLLTKLDDPNRKYLTLNLASEQQCLITIEAENLGRVGGNTVTVEISEPQHRRKTIRRLNIKEINKPLTIKIRASR